MPFGSNKRLSAPRPKKKKVEAREDAEGGAAKATVPLVEGDRVVALNGHALPVPTHSHRVTTALKPLQLLSR